MDVVNLIIMIFMGLIILFLPLIVTVVILLVLSKISRKMQPLFQNIGDRLGAILFKKRKEREREYIENLHIAECLKENFCMPIEKVVFISGPGTVVVGTVEAGICREGELAYLEQEEGRLGVFLGHIDLETLRRKPDGKAYRTEHIAVALGGISKEQVKVGGKLIIENAFRP